MDLSEPEACTRVLLDLWPDAIVNCAAISSPDFVNQNPEYAWNINVNGAQKLAQIASHLGARHIHISTDMVFPTGKPYRSTDQPSPLSEYGRQKLEAEKKVLSVSDENIVVLAITLLNGNSPQGNRSPHERILGTLRKNAPVVLFDDEYRQPCSTHEVASVILELLERPNLNGLFHWAGSELITRYELGLRILEKFGFDHKKITRASIESEVERVGNRPACLAFELQPLRGKLKTESESIESQLSFCRCLRVCILGSGKMLIIPEFMCCCLNFTMSVQCFSSKCESGVKNMATDWWLFENAKVPSFRHYQWKQVETSFGYGQDWQWVATNKHSSSGFDTTPHWRRYR